MKGCMNDGDEQMKGRSNGGDEYITYIIEVSFVLPSQANQTSEHTTPLLGHLEYNRPVPHSAAL